jgi:hypothetical protein
MPNPAAAPDRADRNIVGRIAKDSRRRHPLHESIEIVGLSGITTQQPVLSKRPQVSRLSRRLLRQGRHGVLRIGTRRPIGEKQIDFGGLKPRQRDIHALSWQELNQLAEFNRKEFKVPSSPLGDLVVGDHIGALLRRGEVIEPDDWHMGKTKEPRSLETPVASQNAIVGVRYYRVEKTERSYARGDLLELLLRMRSPVPQGCSTLYTESVKQQ